jgi:ADP-ribose pyrophosphatase
MTPHRLLRPFPDHPDARIEGRETVWNGHYPLEVVTFRNRRFDGTLSEPRRWELWRRGQAAAFLPYDPVADAVLLIDQFRLPALAAGLAPVLTEIPAGLCDPGESPDATLIREAEEEIGLVPRRLHPIGTFMLSPGACDETILIAIGEITAPDADAEGIVGTAGLAHEHEDIRVRRQPAAEAIEDALAGRIANSVAAIALLWFAARRDWLRQLWKDPA